MKWIGLVVLFLSLACVASAAPNACYRKNPNVKPLVLTPLPHTYLKASELPATYDPRNLTGHNMVSVTRNQHIPGYCGACWAFAATSSLNDRMKMASNGSWPEVDLSVQVILNCDKADEGCHGGDPISAFEFIKNFGGIPDETCALYEATGHDLGAQCGDIDVCRDCSRSKGCWARKDYKKYSVSEYGLVNGESKMMAEIYARGPITCGIAVPNDFFYNYTGGIYRDASGTKEITHAISVVGWGVSADGVKYWVGRNSWGSWWGEQGWFRIVRGQDNLAIESDCQWAVPEVPKTLQSAEYLRKSAAAAASSEKKTPFATCRDGKNKWSEKRVLTPRPHTYLKASSLPASFDWRNVNKTNWLTWTVNQHIPKYCGSCWAQAVASVLSDRLNIQRKGAWPKVEIAPQVLLNCNGGGSCNGGWPSAAYSYIEKNGISDQTCAPYEAYEKACSPMGVCYDCLPNATSWSPGSCVPVKKPHLYGVSEYADVEGADKMKAEIFARGPISCGVSVTDKFVDYKGGIYSEKTSMFINHEIEVVGWGVENGTEYWIGRNSWGTYWGIDGFFYIKMHEDNLSIEEDCSWGVPKQIQ